jgi:DNA topoisomerase I
MGHIRALKPDLDSVGIERDWTPTYESIQTKASTIKQLKTMAADAEEVILATDDDREGEGIAFHICAILKLNPLTTKRILFHAITKEEIQQAIQNPKLIDMNKFQSQQCRAMLDMLIGYTLSPVLWKQLNSNGLPLSAGRCQTPALKLVLDRDQEIENHKANRFWSFVATFTVGILKGVEASRADMKEDQETLEYLHDATQTTRAMLTNIKESLRTHKAPKPLITSSLQQEASSLYNIQPKTTMSAAQKLYEAGHITYMRTDNAFLSQEGAALCRSHIKAKFAPEYEGPAGQHQGQSQELPKKTKKAAQAQAKPEAQAAHEAIRPTHPEVEVAGNDPLEQKVYRLIWTRALQSQMATATEDCRALTFTLEADETKAPWSAEQTKFKFQGWKALSATEKTNASDAEAQAQWLAWSKVAVNAVAKWLTVVAEESYSKAKARYTEASLIHELETKGIGRPSTFANLVSTVIDRGYVEKSDSAGTQIDIKKWIVQKPQEIMEHLKKLTVGKESNKLQTTPLGRTVAEFIYKYYADIFDYTYTATMEQELDHIAKGERPWKTLLQSSWDQYKERYEEHTKTVLDPEAKKAQGQAKKRDLGEGIAVILSKKGPLLLKEESKEFAALPQGTSFDTVTLAQAQKAYAMKDGLPFGVYKDQPITKKKGPYGFYAQWQDIKVPFKVDDTLETIVAKLEQKANPSPGAPAFERKVGEFTIKQGPYGLYFFKPAQKKVQFVSLPTTADKEKVTAEELTALYTAGLKAKKWKKKE